MTNIIDGKALSLKVKSDLKLKVADFNAKFNRDITLAVVLVGENPASKVYVKNKILGCEFVGIKSLAFYLPETSSTEDVLSCVNSLCQDKTVDGILVQLPLPKHIDEDKVLSAIVPEKDVDGFKEENIGKLCMNLPSTVACTPYGIITMLKEYGVSMSGKNAVVIGRSNIVGKPVAMLLLNENCTVTVCHSKTQNLPQITSKADILVAAIGRPKFVTEDMVKEGAVVIDVGINRTEDGLVGDVDFEKVKDKCALITPVPGGVGPMTIAMLLQNTYNCALRREGC